MAVVLVLLFGRSTPPPVVGVLFATEVWLRGSIAGVAVVDVPEGLAPLFITPDGIGNSVAAFDIPANTFITPGMLRGPGANLDDEGGLSTIRLPAGVGLWPMPGPAPGDEAVVGQAGGTCALAVTELLEVDTEGQNVTVAVTPGIAGRLIAAGDLTIWPPAGGTWPACPPSEGPPPILDAPPGTARIRLTTNAERWPLPGPVPGDDAVVGPAGTACSLVTTTVLDSDEVGNVTVALTPETASLLAARGDLAVWPVGSGVWPPCTPTIPEGTAPVRLPADPLYWPPPGPAAGDLAVIGPSGVGCALLVTHLLGTDGPSVTLAVTPDVAARLMGEPALAVWPPTTDGTWPFCDFLEPDPAGHESGGAEGGGAAAVPTSARECEERGGTWNQDTVECEGVV
ncbi:MAG: hypothetical protein OXS29_13565 [bacterium]|nr:hypothetical protein [bacterium]MDE0289554.1 hypothetical protein [bacterium]MDE0437710.1 hypothetical protein [bacterium]